MGHLIDIFNSNSEPCEEIRRLLAELKQDRLKVKYRPDIDNEEVLLNILLFLNRI